MQQIVQVVSLTWVLESGSNMKKLSITTLLILVLAVTNSWGNDLYSDKQAEKIAKVALKDKDISLKQKLDISHFLGKPEPVSMYLFDRESGNDFYVIITQAKGRYDMFDYLVTVNLDLEIEKVKVLKYRSEHGGEIASKKWLEQFTGYSTGELKYKKDISAISGATMSASSITLDIPLVLSILRSNIKSIESK